MILAYEILVILRPLLALMHAKKVPFRTASFSLYSTLSLVMPLITLAVHTHEAFNRALLALLLLLGETAPDTDVRGTPTESDTLPRRAASKFPVITSCCVMPSNIYKREGEIEREGEREKEIAEERRRKRAK